MNSGVDDFANAQKLTGLPASVTSTNADATRESLCLITGRPLLSGGRPVS